MADQCYVRSLLILAILDSFSTLGEVSLAHGAVVSRLSLMLLLAQVSLELDVPRGSVL